MKNAILVFSLFIVGFATYAIPKDFHKKEIKVENLSIIHVSNAVDVGVMDLNFVADYAELTFINLYSQPDFKLIKRSIPVDDVNPDKENKLATKIHAPPSLRRN